MMKQQLRFLNGFVASMAVLAFATSARADITWILQPSSTITMTAQFGSTDDNNNVIESSTLDHGRNIVRRIRWQEKEKSACQDNRRIRPNRF